MSKPKPLRWRKANGEYHADIQPGWGISICPQATTILWFVEVEEAHGLSIVACGSAETLAVAKKESTKAADLALSNAGKPRPKYYGAKVKCLNCGCIIQSKHRHDYTSCRCGALSIDGGGEYCRMVGIPGGYQQIARGRYFLE